MRIIITQDAINEARDILRAVSLYGAAMIFAPDVHILYECGICDWYHPWSFNGDCRENEYRFAFIEDYAAKLGIDISLIEVRSWEERLDADTNGENIV